MALAPNYNPVSRQNLNRGNPGPHPGSGRPSLEIRAKALRKIQGESGKSYAEILDELAQGSNLPAEVIAAIRTQYQLAGLDKPEPPPVILGEELYNRQTMNCMARHHEYMAEPAGLAELALREPAAAEALAIFRGYAEFCEGLLPGMAAIEEELAASAASNAGSAQVIVQDG